MERPQAQGTPSLVYTIESEEPEQTHSEDLKYYVADVDVTAYTDDHSDGLTSKIYVIQALNRQTITDSSSVKYDVLLESSSTTVAAPTDGSDRPVFLTQILFRVRYNDAH
tara:strand:- start:67 stop:396 length:330 start_codon:yes stop_codon:yes gene_type:complete